MKILILSLIISIFFNSKVFSSTLDNSSNSKVNEAKLLYNDTIKLDFDSFIYFPIVFNNKVTAKAFFDTGASGMPLMDKATSSKLGVDLYSDRSYYTCLLTGCVNAIMPKNGVHAQVGKINFTQKFPVYKKESWNSNVLLGWEFLKGKNVRLDLETSKIIISEPSSLKENIVPIKLVENKLCVELLINISDGNTFRGLFVIDTGYQGFVNIFETNNTLQDLISKIEAKRKRTTIGLRKTYFRADSLKIGNICIHNPCFRVRKKKDEKKYVGLLGNDFLKRFCIDMNLDDMTLSLKPNKDFELETFNNTLGISIKIIKNDKKYRYAVNSIFVGSNAEKHLLPNDMLVEINGVTTENMSIQSIREYLYMEPNTKMKIKIKRNGQILEKEFAAEKIL
jgi:predicted aspartyl protease